MTEPDQEANNQNPDQTASPSNQPSESTDEQLNSANNQRGHSNTTNRHSKRFKTFRNWTKRENQATGGIANIIAFIALTLVR